MEQYKGILGERDKVPLRGEQRGKAKLLDPTLI
jgi:hypothetical protein